MTVEAIRPALTAQAWIYFVRHGDMIKIGSAQNARGRFWSMKGTSPVPLEFLGVIPGTQMLERQLHDRWIKHHVRNEWFNAAPEVLSFIKDNARIPEGGIPNQPPNIDEWGQIDWSKINRHPDPENSVSTALQELGDLYAFQWAKAYELKDGRWLDAVAHACDELSNRLEELKGAIAPPEREFASVS